MNEGCGFIFVLGPPYRVALLWIRAKKLSTKDAGEPWRHRITVMCENGNRDALRDPRLHLRREQRPHDRLGADGPGPIDCNELPISARVEPIRSAGGNELPWKQESGVIVRH